MTFEKFEVGLGEKYFVDEFFSQGANLFLRRISFSDQSRILEVEMVILKYVLSASTDAPLRTGACPDVG